MGIERLVEGFKRAATTACLVGLAAFYGAGLMGCTPNDEIIESYGRITNGDEVNVVHSLVDGKAVQVGERTFHFMDRGDVFDLSNYSQGDDLRYIHIVDLNNDGDVDFSDGDMMIIGSQSHDTHADRFVETYSSEGMTREVFRYSEAKQDYIFFDSTDVSYEENRLNQEAMAYDGNVMLDAIERHFVR